LDRIKKKRTDLKIIISSATLDAQAFKDFFEDNKTKNRNKDTAVILSVEGRQYPVEVFYTRSAVRDYVAAVAQTVQTIHETMPPGDVLVFMTGREEIDKTVHLLTQGDTDLSPMPLYAGLPVQQQMNVFKPTSEGAPQNQPYFDPYFLFLYPSYVSCRRSNQRTEGPRKQTY